MKKLYAKIRRIIPPNLQGYLTYLIYSIGLKPSVNKHVKSPFKKGIIVLSADFEMAWAFRYSKKRRNMADEMGLHERKNVPLLLALFERYNIPVTWATVGHLFLDSCNKSSNELAHPEMPRPDYFENTNWIFDQGDWYDADPCSSQFAAPAWYAPDLIEKIILSPVHHEIGCHTFSHIDCTTDHCSPELLKAELEACIDVATAKGLKLTSIVFPGGTLGNYSVLKEMGFTSFRKQMKYHIDLPVVDNLGLVYIPSSYNMCMSPYGWNAKTYVRMASSFINKSAKSKMVAHLWFHPSMDRWYLENVLPGVLEKIRIMADNGSIEVLTMAQLTLRTHELERSTAEIIC